MRKDDSIYIDHIIHSIGKIEKYVSGLNKREFIANEMVQDAVIRQFGIIGEATKQLSIDFKERNTEIPWKLMAGMRDVLIHDYLGVDIWQIWETIINDIPKLKSQITELQ